MFLVLKYTWSYLCTHFIYTHVYVHIIAYLISIALMAYLIFYYEEFITGSLISMWTCHNLFNCPTSTEHVITNFRTVINTPVHKYFSIALTKILDILYSFPEFRYYIQSLNLRDRKEGECTSQSHRKAHKTLFLSQIFCQWKQTNCGSKLGLYGISLSITNLLRGLGFHLTCDFS